MEGLEISEIKFSNEFNLERLDSDFYKKKILIQEKTLLNNKFKLLKELSYVSDGNHMTIAEEYSTTEGVRYLRGQDVSTDMLIEERNAVFIPESEFDKLVRSHIFKNDILVTIVGANTGCIGLVFNPPEKLTANCKLGIIRIENESILAGYLYSYLCSSFGQLQIQRQIRGGGQSGLLLLDLRELKILRLSNLLEQQISNLSNDAHTLLIKANDIYTQAENILLQELGLANWQPTIKNNNTKTLKESFLQTGRIDAEYYQPKYDEVISKVSHIKNDILGNIVTIQKSIEPGSDAYQNSGIPFIRVADLSKNGLSESSVFLSPAEFGNYPLMPKANTILLSKDGSVGIAYKLETDVYGITSSAILHLAVNRNDVLPDYLCLVINSMIVKLQAERDAGGSIIQHWKPDEIKQVIIPIVDDAIQINISQKVQESFSLQKQSKHLLEVAKKAVEIAIEQSEAAAIKYINQNKNA